MKPEWLEHGYSVEPKGMTPILIRQVHGKSVLQLRGDPPSPPPEADAVYTHELGRTIFVSTADCLPVFFYTDDKTGPIAAVHAGWRGALSGVITETIRQMATPANSLFAVLGPSIGVCCFEVKEDFIQKFEVSGRRIRPYLQVRAGRTFCDLVSFVREQELAGLCAENIDQSTHRCTVCSLPALPSYRRNTKADPLIRSWIRKKP